ncbi:hypothetical protein A2415_02665 [candidate division WWE3 bacterium RIFOXYC1_FULL_39_7]|uniref:Uncharacterized protein n=2 Tax=Katanobacteria TaxID=422282 RepID=A0A1F4X6A8_UNCKA|nr:MAG: hypothetical protein A2415_02665 [candidate division WWE3 bacterium RIFOXYC1_FULL_39_7]OGC76643.1 MAG: hypothetical protein A2619_04315 [candidate division WWE3 bacterium RIFOXYD1_FULL_39_9]
MMRESLLYSWPFWFRRAIDEFASNAGDRTMRFSRMSLLGILGGILGGYTISFLFREGRWPVVFLLATLFYHVGYSYIYYLSDLGMKNVPPVILDCLAVVLWIALNVQIMFLVGFITSLTLLKLLGGF